MVANAGVISVEVEAQLGKLDEGLRRAEAKVKQSTEAINRSATITPSVRSVRRGLLQELDARGGSPLGPSPTAQGLGRAAGNDGPFGSPLVGSLARAFVGIKALETGMRGFTALLAAARGDADAMWESLGRIPILGQLITGFRDLKAEITGSRREAQALAEAMEVTEQLLQQSPSQRFLAERDAMKTGGTAGVARAGLDQETAAENLKLVGQELDIRQKLTAAELSGNEALANQYSRQLVLLVGQKEALFDAWNVRRKTIEEERKADAERLRMRSAELEGDALREPAEVKRRLMDEDRRRAEESIRETQRQTEQEADRQGEASRKRLRELEEGRRRRDEEDRKKNEAAEGEVFERRNRIGLLRDFIDDRTPRFQMGEQVRSDRTNFSVFDRTPTGDRGLVARAERMLNTLEAIEQNTRDREIREVLGSGR